MAEGARRINSGNLPDLGNHWNDLPFWALNLRHPITIEAEGPPVSPETAPEWMILTWRFPARKDDKGVELPPVKHTWRQGGKKPPLVEQGKVPGWDSGVLFIGEDGMILSDYGKHILLPEERAKSIKRPQPWIPKSIGHHAEWVRACKTASRPRAASAIPALSPSRTCWASSPTAPAKNLSGTRRA